MPDFLRRSRSHSSFKYMLSLWKRCVQGPADKGSQPSSSGRLIIRFVTITTLIIATRAEAQITNVTNDQAVPTPGVGHDYIGILNDVVSPSNGSLSIRIAIPTPPGRGLSLPLQIYYNSNGILQFGSGVGFSPGGDGSGQGTYTGYVSLASNKDSNLIEQGGWGYGFPQLSATYIQVPGNSQTYTGATCPIATGFVFSDLSGSRHALNLALPNYSICNSLGGVAPGYSMNSSYSTYDGTYFANTVNGGSTSSNDITGIPFSIQDNNGTYYHFPYLQPACLSDCNIPDYIEDRNGNIIRFSQGSASNPNATFPINVTDTLGRQLVSISSFLSSAGDQISVSGYSLPYKIQWESVPINATIPLTSDSSNQASCGATFYPSTSATMLVVKSIQLPDEGVYQFQYDQTYGLLNKITYPTGAYVQYDWGLANSVPGSSQDSDAVSYAQYGTLPILSPEYLDDCWAEYSAPVILHRYVSFDGQHIAEQQDFTYVTNFIGAGEWSSKITTVKTTDNLRANPQGSTPVFQTVYTYSPEVVPPPPDITPVVASLVPVEHTTAYYDFSGTLLQTVTKTWVGNPANPVLGEQDLTLSNGSTSRTVYQRDNYENVIEKDEYDFGQSSPTRTTTYQYQSFSGPSEGPIADLPCRTVVYAGTTGGTKTAETDVEYDNGASVCGTSGTPSVTPVSNLPANTHDETKFGSRGNATTVTNWANVGVSATTTYTYDETGQTTSSTQPCGNTGCSDISAGGYVTSYSYSDYPSGGNAAGNSNAYLTQITNPMGQVRTFSYDYPSGKLIASTDLHNSGASGNTTNYYYNTKPSQCSSQDELDRLSEVDYPDTGKTEYCYNDSVPSIATAILQAGSTWRTNLQTMDGMGHVISSTTSDPLGADTVASGYDGEGNVCAQSNPTRASLSALSCTAGSNPTSSSPTDGITYSSDDALGRKIAQTDSDGVGTQSWTYSGNTVTYKDENGNQWTRTSDAFGRLTQVAEPNGSSASPTMITSYSYDALNNLVSATQNGVSGSTARSRSFTYDSLSRLIQSFNPESGTITYSYDANGNLQSKTSPLVNASSGSQTISYCYDSLNRMMYKSYASLSCASPNGYAASYAYDSSGVSGAQNDMGRLTDERSYVGGTLVSERQPFAYDAMGRLLSEIQTVLPGMTGSKTFSPSYQYDLAGDLTASTDGATPIQSASTSLPTCVTAPPSWPTLTLFNCFDQAGRTQSVTSNWANYPTNLFTIGASGYFPAGQLQNWTQGSTTSGASALTFTQGYNSRLWLNNITVNGQIPSP